MAKKLTRLYFYLASSVPRSTRMLRGLPRLMVAISVIAGAKTSMLTPKYVPAVPPAIVVEKLSELRDALPQLSAQQVNPVIRMLGKKRLISQIFSLLDDMRDCANHRDTKKKNNEFSMYQPYSPLRPDSESLEFLANALVATVDEESKCRTMKDLPQPVETMPEVLLMGRSNVGKSSLVNFLLNRKARIC